MTVLTTPGSLVQWWKEDFESFVHHLGQQDVSRLRMCVRNRTGTGDIFNYEILASKEMEQKTTRNETLNEASGTPIVHSRRASKAATWRWYESVDRADIVRIMTDPESEYMMSATMSHGRQIDRIIAESSVATSGIYSTLQGVAGGGSVSGTADPGTGIGFDATGGALTLTKLRTAKAFLDKAEVGVVQGGPRYCWINADALEDLLTVTEVTSADYNTVKALVNGELNTFLGFDFVRTELIPLGAATNILTNGKRGVICMERASMGLSISDERFTRIGEDASIGFSTRVYTESTMGAARIENGGIYAIDLD